MTAQPRKEPRVLGAPKKIRWNLADNYRGKGPAMFDALPRRTPRPVEVPRPKAPAAAKMPARVKAKPCPPHRMPEALALLPAGFGKLIRAARVELGLSVARAAETWGMSEKTLYRWESANGALSVEIDRLRRVC